MPKTANGSNGSSGGGNTNSPARVNPAKKWVFTWNNYPIEWMETMAPKLKGFLYIIGKEKGEQGTKHLQGYIEAYKKIRPIEHFKIKNIHWEKAKGTREQNIEYCSKEGDYIIEGLPVKEKIIDICENDLKKWQEDIIELINKEPDPRIINYYYDTKGNSGKSTLSKHLFLKYYACILSGKSTDCKYLIAKYIENKKKNPKIIIWDIPRTMNEFINWEAVESIKNGLFNSNKYECTTICMNPPHVIIFSNIYPDTTTMSIDRWRISDIGD